ncbi:hypothetical protein, partial [Pseudomonas syringae]|uniref:hypothetical protein n=1 Tax=Pseudomonas syringae TaxID=317 RepID=UPI0013E957EB
MSTIPASAGQPDVPSWFTPATPRAALKQARRAVFQPEPGSDLPAVLPGFDRRGIQSAHSAASFAGQAAEELPARLVEGQCRHA